MLKHTRRLFRSQVTWGITLVLLAPTFAAAQQTGLFPLAPIRRQRVPCPDENPIYGRYRRDYYGYYPTCWRRFPPGWGCPSPEAPNMERAYRDIKPDPTPATPDDESGDEMPDRGRRDTGDNGPRPNKPDIPPLQPRGRSPLDPLDLDTPNAAPNPNTPSPRRDSPPPVQPQPLPDDRQPRGSGGPAAGLGAANVRAPRTPQAIQFEPSNTPIQSSSSDPLLPLPDPPAATTQPISAPISSEPLGVSTDAGMDTGLPMQAPRRRSLIGGFFDSLGIKRR